eukprot:3761170-Rhodomonas_salina.2
MGYALSRTAKGVRKCRGGSHSRNPLTVAICLQWRVSYAVPGIHSACGAGNWHSKHLVAAMESIGSLKIALVLCGRMRSILMSGVLGDTQVDDKGNTLQDSSDPWNHVYKVPFEQVHNPPKQEDEIKNPQPMTRQPQPMTLSHAARWRDLLIVILGPSRAGARP